MSEDRPGRTRVAALSAALLLVALMVLDLAVPGDVVVLAPLFALSPLVAAAFLPAGPAAGFAVTATFAALLAGWWDGTWGDPQMIVRVIDVALVSAASVVVAAVRVSREQRYSRVAAIAEVAQRTILPSLPEQTGHAKIGARYVSAADDAFVGGDLYDYFSAEGRVRFVIGDVRGKGLTAVEQAARVIRAFRQAAAATSSLSEQAAEMSRYLAGFFDPEEFATGALVDTSTPGQIRVVSAGHPPPLLVRTDGTCEFLESPTGLPFGWGVTYEEHCVSWAVGDRLLLYTDGLSEARDQRGEFLDLTSCVPQLGAPDGLEPALKALLRRVEEHLGARRPADDMALVLLENAATAVWPTGPVPALEAIAFEQLRPQR